VATRAFATLCFRAPVATEGHPYTCGITRPRIQKFVRLSKNRDRWSWMAWCLAFGFHGKA